MGTYDIRRGDSFKVCLWNQIVKIHLEMSIDFHGIS